jgi:predicted hydrocarbon binding protein
MKEFFGSLLGKLRKHFGMETVSVFTVRNLYISSFMDLMEEQGYEKAARKMFSWGYSMGHEYMLTLTKDVEKLKPFEDTPLVAKLAWYFFSGRSLAGVKDWWEEWLDKRVYLLKFWDDDSPWCRGIELSGKKMCFYPAGAYEGAYQTAQLIMGLDRVAIVRETACKASGDDRCEFLIIDLPFEGEKQIKDLLEEAGKRVPGIFDVVPFTMSLELRKGVI